MRPGNSPSLKPPLKGEHFQQQHQHTHSWGASLNPSIIAMGPGNFGAPLTFFQPAVDPAFLATHHQAWKSEGGILAMAYQQQPLAGQSAGHYPIEAMFGSQNTYGGYNNSYGNAPYYPPPSNPDQFWGNKQHQQQQQQNRVNYRNDQDPALANDSLYGYQNDAYPEQSLDGSVNHIETGISGLSIQSKQSDDLGPPSFASIGSRKPTSWASVASQPAKSQPKSLKSKMAASGLTGSTSKHLPPTVTMDALSWEAKNGNSAGGKSVPPPAVIAPAAPAIPPQSIVPSSPVEELPSPTIIQTQQTSPPQRPLSNQASGSSWATNGNSSSSGSISTSAGSPRPQKESILPPGNGMPRASYNSNSGNNGTSERGMRGPMNYEINENYNPNKYSNQRNHHSQQSNYSKPLLDNPMPYSSARNVGPPTLAARERPESPPVSRGNDGPSDDFSRADMEKLLAENNYNPKEFDLNPRNARFFIIKSYSEDDVHRSIKYSIWCSTDHGNKRLDTAFRNQGDSGPIYLFYSVNRSGHFCGVAQMMSHVDYNASAGVWAQDKWKGQFQVKWIYVKDVPNDELRHITLENNENKPVTNSRDTQEVPFEKGKKVLSIIHNYHHGTSIFDDFLHYELKQEEEQRKPDLPDSPPPVNNYPKMGNSGMPPRDGQMPFRGHPNGNNYSKPRSYPDPRDQRDGGGDYRGEYRNDHRGNDYRPERNDYRNDRMDRAPEYGRDHRDHRNMEPHRNEYRERDVHGPRDGGRDYSREYNREPREPPFHRDPYHRDYNAPAGGGGGGRDYQPRERNEYRPQEHREFRERADHRERVPHDRSSQQSWRN